jgi:hypothetical protein
MEKVSSRERLFLLEMSNNLRMSFAANSHLAEGLYLRALLMLKAKKNSYLPCR